MISTTAGRLWLSHGLPAKYRDHTAKLDSKGVSALLDRVAREDPEDYPKVVKHLIDVGKTVAYRTGGYSFGLKSLRRPAAAIQVGDQIRTALASLYADPRTSQQEKRDAAIDAIAKAGEGYEKKVYDEALADKNPIALQVLSGSRGKPSTLQTLIGGDLMYQDSTGRPIPVPVTRSYSQGLTPAMYYSGAYGARTGVIGTKLCVLSDSLVRMADWSVKKIKDIRPGEMVLGADQEGNTFPVRVTRVFDNGTRPVKRFVFRYGKSRTQTVTLEATADHKVLARTSKRTQTDSKEYRETGVRTTRTALGVRPVGDCERSNAMHTVALQPAAGFTGPGVNEPWAWWIGLLTGDGGLTGHNVYFSNNNQTLLDEFRRQLCAEGFALNKKGATKYEYLVEDTDKALVFQSGQNRRIHRLKTKLAALGLLGKSASEKELPIGINNWDNESVAAYIRGVFDTDGSVKASNNSTGPLISLGVTSSSLVSGIRDLLAWRFGIYGQTCVVKTKGRPVGIVSGSVANHDLHELMISDRQSVRRYRELVGFVESSKIDRLDAGVLTDDQEKSGRESRFAYHYMASEVLGDLPTFDLEVDHPDHLFVMANGLIVSNSTAHSGFLSKQLVGSSHRLITGALDHDEAAHGPDPNTHRGLPVDTDDKGNVGSLLARDMGGYRRNTVLTGKILRDLKDQGLERILVRSPITSSSHDGTIYGRDAGVRERGGIPAAGDQIGIAAAQAIGEIVSQTSLGSKHGGGISKGVSQGPTGFKLLNLLAQAPKGSPFWAAHAGEDGAVKDIEPSPAGGWVVRVGSSEHHVPPTAELRVKPGDRVEAGDLLSSGIPDPNELVRHLGVGEARNRFMQEFRKAVGAGSTERRNLELVSRGLINHVKMTDEHDDWLPDDVVPYDVVERSWKPREDATVRRPHEAVGHYLESPALHYSVGTKIRPSVAKELQHFGVESVTAHDKPPPFQPHFVRAMENLQNDPDAFVQHMGSNLQKSTLKAVHRGGTSDENSTSFVPSLMRGKDFGKAGPVKSYALGDVSKVL